MNETVRAFLKKLESARDMDLDVVDPEVQAEHERMSQDRALPRDQQESDLPTAAGSSSKGSGSDHQLIS